MASLTSRMASIRRLVRGSPPRTRSGAYLEPGHVVLRRRGRGPLAEDVEQAEGEERGEEPKPLAASARPASFTVARDAEDDLVGHVRHG